MDDNPYVGVNTKPLATVHKSLWADEPQPSKWSALKEAVAAGTLPGSEPMSRPPKQGGLPPQWAALMEAVATGKLQRIDSADAVESERRWSAMCEEMSAGNQRSATPPTADRQSSSPQWAALYEAMASGRMQPVNGIPSRRPPEPAHPTAPMGRRIESYDQLGSLAA